GALCLHDLVRARARRSPNAPALLAPGRPALGYARLQAHLDETMARLKAFGIGRDDCVAIALPNGPELAVALLAVSATAVAGLVNPDGSPDEAASLLARLEPKALITEAGLDTPVRRIAKMSGLPVMELSPTREAEAGLFVLRGHPVFRPPPIVLSQAAAVALMLPTAGSRVVPLTHAA